MSLSGGTIYVVVPESVLMFIVPKVVKVGTFRAGWWGPRTEHLPPGRVAPSAPRSLQRTYLSLGTYRPLWYLRYSLWKDRTNAPV